MGGGGGGGAAAVARPDARMSPAAGRISSSDELDDYDDGTGDFALLSAGGFEAAIEAYAALGSAAGAGSGWARVL